MMIHRTLMLLSLLVLLSYLFDLVAKKTRVPAVLLLMSVGFLLKQLVDYYQIEIPVVTRGLFLLGTTGLILIVFEAAMDIHFTWRKTALIRKAFFSALFNFIGVMSIVSALFHYYFNGDFYTCLLSAVPFSVVSSAIAIPSVEHLDSLRKEFIVIESAFSDIIGIMAFYFLLDYREVSASAMAMFGLNTIATIALSVVFGLLVFFILSKNKHKVKFFLVIALLIFVYGYTKRYLHMPALLIVFILGLSFKNAHQIPWGYFKRNFLYDNFQSDFNDISKMNSEFAFVIRTFFFIVLGYTINVTSLQSSHAIHYGALILTFIFGFRFLYSIITTRQLPIPESMVNPRGLISILLFMNIPDPDRIIGVGDDLLMIVIIGSSLIMAFGMILSNLARKN